MSIKNPSDPLPNEDIVDASIRLVGDQVPNSKTVAGKNKLRDKVMKVKSLKDARHFSLWQLLSFALVFGLIGSYIIFRSFAATPVPTATIVDSDDIFTYGASPTLNYSATNATSCTINGAPVSAADGDNFYTAPAVTTDTTYTLSCSGSGRTVNVSTSVAVAPAPEAITNAASSNQSTTDTVYANKINFIEFCSSDVCKQAPNEPSLESLKKSVRDWYTDRVGKSFYVGSMDLKVVHGNHKASWYINTGKEIPIFNTLQNVSNFLNTNGKVPAGNIDSVVLGFPVNDHCGAGFTAGGTVKESVSNFSSSTDVGVTDPFYCQGQAVISDVAHELGHSFGLKHDNMKGGASCASTSSKRNGTLMDCNWACNGNGLTDCKLSGYAYNSSTPDWKLLADYSPFFN